PGPAELTWNWRWELGIIALLAVPSGLIAAEFGLLGLAFATGAGLAARTAASLGWPGAPPMVHRPGLVPHHAAPGPGWVRERLGADQGRQAAIHPGDHAHGLRRAGARLAARRPHLRGPAGRQGCPRGRLLGDGSTRHPKPKPRATGDARNRKNQSSRTRAADSGSLAAFPWRGGRRAWRG